MSALDNISNYTETLVMEVLSQRMAEESFDEGAIADILCLALNELPPKYIRYDVDLMFYTTDTERVDRYDRVAQAVDKAIAFVRENAR